MTSLVKCLVVSLLLRVASGEGNGACMDAADQKVWESGIKANISGTQQDCILKGAPGAAWYDHCIKHFMNSSADGERCMADCVERRTSLSASCSGCFGKIAKCTYEHCISSCMDAKSPACTACGDKYCKADFRSCSGINDLPGSMDLTVPSLPGNVMKIVHDLICKELVRSSTSKVNVAKVVCEKVHSKVKFLPEGACETAAELLLEREDLRQCKQAVTTAAELRRWGSSENCTGNYSVLNTDNMDECTQYLIPAPASIWVTKKNVTAYSSFHCQGVLDCSEDKRVLLRDWIVGTCEAFDGYSQMRVWVAAPHTQIIV